jgi:hypothetical protein
MHGLVNRSLQCFLRDTYGDDLWQECARSVGLGPEGFEAMLDYEDSVTLGVVDAAVAALGKPRDALLEDLGTYMVSHPNSEPIRRLLRFSGASYVEFLHALDDLPDRARLAVGDLDLPALELVEEVPGRFTLHVGGPDIGFASVLAGALRAMADDYGALALIEAVPSPTGAGGGPDDLRGTPQVAIALLDRAFAEGRSFTLAQPQTGTASPGGARP